MSTFSQPRKAWLSASACALLALSGCTGGNAGTVSGKVTLAGKAVPGGRLKLHPKGEGVEYPITFKDDGTFSVTGVPPGDYAVTVESISIADPMGANAGGGPGMTEDMKKMMEEGIAKAKAEGKAYPMPGGGGGGGSVTIPLQYTDPKTTPLSWTVNKGKNDSKEFALSE